MSRKTGQPPPARQDLPEGDKARRTRPQRAIRQAHMKPRHRLLAVKIDSQDSAGIRHIDKGNFTCPLAGLVMGYLDAAQGAASVEIDNRAVWRSRCNFFHISITIKDRVWTYGDEPTRCMDPKPLTRYNKLQIMIALCF
jgi:hypothetical protein